MSATKIATPGPVVAQRRSTSGNSATQVASRAAGWASMLARPAVVLAHRLSPIRPELPVLLDVLGGHERLVVIRPSPAAQHDPRHPFRVRRRQGQRHRTSGGYADDREALDPQVVGNSQGIQDIDGHVLGWHEVRSTHPRPIECDDPGVGGLEFADVDQIRLDP